MNIKRFITIFLAIAILVSTGAWFWSNRGDERRIAPRGVVSEEPTSINNAFVRGEQSATEMAVAKDNMTYRLAESLAAKMQEYNPDGPGDASNPGIWQPNAEMVLEEFLTKKEIYGPVVLDQAAALAKRTKLEEVNVLENASPEETANYLQAFAQIAQENFLDKRVQGLIEETATPETISALAVVIGQSLRRLDELQVPKDYLDMHISLRDVVIDLQQILEAPITGTEDPVRTILAVENQKNLIAQSTAKFAEEMEKVKLKDTSNLGLGGRESFWGIKTAHAFCIPFVVCFTFDIAQLGAQGVKMGQDIAKWVRGYVTETLKDVLVHKLIQQTIGWIQGNGKPKFITNWKSFLGDVANQAGGDFLYRINPKLCTSFGPMIRVALTPVTTAPDKGITCTLDQVMSNVQDFYDNFSNGGWIAYGATLQPSNNFFGAYMQASDMLMVEKAQKTQAKESEAKSSSGFLGTKMCTKWEYRAPQADPTDPAYISCINQCKLSPVVDCEKECAPQGPPQKVCVEEKTTTPGDMVAKALGDLPGAPLQRIVNAQDITALVNALVNAAMSKLVSAAKNIGPDSNGDPGVLGLENSAKKSGFGKFCEGLSGQAYEECAKGARQACQQLPPEQRKDCLDAIQPEDPNGLGPTPPKVGLGNSVNPPPPMDIVGFSNVIWIDRDVKGFTETTNLSSSFNSGAKTIYLDYDKAGVWPVEDPLGDGTEIVGNAWIFVYRRSNWYAATFDWLRPNQTQKGIENLLSADGTLHGELSNFQMRAGEHYYVLVSTPVRNGYQPKLQERSNAVEVVAPSAL